MDSVTANRSIAIRVNPRPFVSHKFKVLKYLRLEEGYEPEGISAKDWKSILDHFDNDGSTSLQRGVFYLEGDTIEVNRFEASDLLSVLPGYFDPSDELTKMLAREIRGGDR